MFKDIIENKIKFNCDTHKVDHNPVTRESYVWFKKANITMIIDEFNNTYQDADRLIEILRSHNYL